MRLIAQAAAPTQKRDKKDKKGKEKKDKRHGDKLTKRDRKGSSSLDEEGFGDEAGDWEVYRVMDVRGSDSGAPLKLVSMTLIMFCKPRIGHSACIICVATQLQPCQALSESGFLFGHALALYKLES